MEGHNIWYYCRLHPNFKNINLSSIEHHCRYHEPDRHKTEILKLLSEIQEIPQETEPSSNDDPDRILPTNQSPDDSLAPDGAKNKK